MAFIIESEAMEQLGLPSNSPALGAMGLFIDAACDYVESQVGPVEPRVVTETVKVGALSRVALRYRPVLSVTSVDSRGTALTVGSYAVDLDAGVLSAVTGYALPSEVTVTYEAGYASPPSWAQLAALIIAQHLYRTRLGPNPSRSGYETTQPSGVGFLVPNQAALLLEPHRLVSVA